MLQITSTPLVNLLQSLTPELVSLLSLICCYAIIILMVKIFKAPGLFIYNAVSVIACNLQVLKAAEFIGYAEPVALGTIIYSSSFLASDALTELYGAKEARKSVGLSFAASIIMLIMMIFTLGHKPLDIGVLSEHRHFNEAHEALNLIFTPNLAIIIASLAAYAASQLSDIYIFSKLKQFTSGKYLWLRIFLSISIAAMIDSILFNMLAWKIFSPYPVSWHSLLFTYIIGAYILQLLVAALNIPALYLLLKIVRK